MIEPSAVMSTRSPKTDPRILGLLAIAFAVASGILWWIGFQGIYGEPEGSLVKPSVFAMIFPAIALLGLSCGAIPLIALAYQDSEWPLKLMPWLKKHYRLGLLVLLTVVAFGLAIGVAALRAFPNSGDEYDYLFQAATFRAGRLWNPLPPLDHVFTFYDIAEKNGRWVSLFFPGWPFILAGVTGLGLPAFVISPALALLLLLAFAHLTRVVAGPAAALLGAALLSCSSFFLLNGASYFAHVPTALFAVLFVVAFVRFLASGSALWALSAGAALGFVGLIRPFTVIPLAIPCGVEILRHASRSHYWRMPLMLLGGAPFLAALLLYDNAITGNPWLTVENWTMPWLHIGLHPVGVFHDYIPLSITSVMGLHHLVVLAEWTSPLLCLLYLLALVWKLHRRRIDFYDFIFPLLVASYLFFPDFGGNQYGPRYYFDAYPFLVLTIVSAAAAWFAEQGRSTALQAGVAASLAGAVIMAITAYPALAYQYHRIVNERMELYDLVARAHLSNAIVIIGSPTGSAYPMWMESPDLTRNGIDFSGSVLYANDVPGGACALQRAFPGRQLYRFGLDHNRYPGRLRPIAACRPKGAN